MGGKWEGETEEQEMLELRNEGKGGEEGTTIRQCAGREERGKEGKGIENEREEREGGE